MTQTMHDCTACQERYERSHDTQGHYVTHTPIGQVKVFVPVPGTLDRLITIARSYAEVRQAVETLEVGTVFTVTLEMNLHRTGDGCYMKTEQGVQAICEHGACKGLLMALDGEPQEDTA